MPTNEKEINNYLFDQLEIIERIEIHAQRLQDPELLKEIEFQKRSIKRKLYQKPPLTEE